MSKIAFYDSGVGGLSVLIEAKKRFQDEEFIMLGDSRFAPFGTKDIGELRKIVFRSLVELQSRDIKAIVIACNTVSSHLLNELRAKLSLPVFGIFPAVDEAVSLAGTKKALILATENTIKGDFMREKKAQYGDRVIPLAGGDIVRFVERGETGSSELKKHVLGLLSGINLSEIGAVALACTQYPFIKPLLSELFSNEVKFVDGSRKTIDELALTLNSLKKPPRRLSSIEQGLVPAFEAEKAENERPAYSRARLEKIELLSSGDNIGIMEALLKKGLEAAL